MKTFGLRVNEEELMALIKHHSYNIMDHQSPLPEMSERLHNLVKRLHKDTPEVEDEKQPEAPAANQPEAPKAGW